MWYEADIDALMKRTAVAADPGRAAGPADRAPFRRRPRLLLGAPDGGRDQLARGRDPRRLDPVLRLRLHDLAEAADAAEHRHRRRRRRLPAADRLGGGDRRRRHAAAAPVRADLPVDAAPFLGAVAVRPLRLCQGRRADAAGGRRREGDPDPDPALHPADGRGRGRALAARPRRPALRRRRGRAQPRLPRRSRCGCSPAGRPSPRR